MFLLLANGHCICDDAILNNCSMDYSAFACIQTTLFCINAFDLLVIREVFIDRGSERKTV